MSADTAETVLVDTKRDGLNRAAMTEEQEKTLRARVRKQYEDQSDPYYATSRIWDDGLIEPSQTRAVLGLCLALAARAPGDDAPRYRVFRM